MQFTRRLAAVLAFLAVLAPASPAFAADTTPPTTPGALVATVIAENSVTLTWPASTDDTAVVGYEVWMTVTDVVQRMATPTTNSATIGGLRRGTTYGFFVVAVDTSGNRSGSSFIRLTTAPGDAIPPTPPGQPVASQVTEASVRITFGLSTDANNVMSYRILRIDGTAETQVGTAPANPPLNSTVIAGLAPGTRYTFGVRAVDAAGNVSALSPTVTVTTLGGTLSCSVQFLIVAQWPGAFQGSVKVTNTGTTPIAEGWVLTWRFADGQQITNLWYATYVQVGPDVTVTNPPWRPRLLPGESHTIGFIASWRGANSVPTSFSLNGVPCTV